MTKLIFALHALKAESSSRAIRIFFGLPAPR
jgi:hypothetical protein